MLMDMEPFSLVDYPGHVAATLFFAGCNFNCGFCHNPALVTTKEKSVTSPSDILEFLQSRTGLLDGVCLTGGEPLLSADMPELARQIKALGFKIKLDTNGSVLPKLQEIAPVLDYIAMDIKAAPARYDELTDSPNAWEKVKDTVEWIKQSGIPYEFRTTVLPVWHRFDDLELIRNLLGPETEWVLQQFREPPGGVLDGKHYEAYPDSWLLEMGKKLNCRLRGLYQG